jgi:hypothetical protein
MNFVFAGYLGAIHSTCFRPSHAHVCNPVRKQGGSLGDIDEALKPEET